MINPLSKFAGDEKRLNLDEAMIASTMLRDRKPEQTERSHPC
ncbi:MULTISPECIES: hypothetical protein [Cyanophyceae]|nr:hypothetical protein [Trichocoleus sp. FACHB-40]